MYKREKGHRVQRAFDDLQGDGQYGRQEPFRDKHVASAKRPGFHLVERCFRRSCSLGLGGQESVGKGYTEGVEYWFFKRMARLVRADAGEV
jgi:hypothetical protein